MALPEESGCLFWVQHAVAFGCIAIAGWVLSLLGVSSPALLIPVFIAIYFLTGFFFMEAEDKVTRRPVRPMVERKNPADEPKAPGNLLDGFENEIDGSED